MRAMRVTVHAETAGAALLGWEFLCWIEHTEEIGLSAPSDNE